MTKPLCKGIHQETVNGKVVWVRRASHHPCEKCDKAFRQVQQERPDFAVELDDV